MPAPGFLRRLLFAAISASASSAKRYNGRRKRKTMGEGCKGAHRRLRVFIALL